MPGDRRTRSNTPAPEVLAREARVVALRRSRMSWPDVAAATGYSTPGSAQRAYARAMSRVHTATTDEQRREEVDMLDRLHAAYWRAALSGDVAAGALLVRISDQRAKYLGLHAALRVKAEVTEATKERVRELVNNLRALPPPDPDDPAGPLDAEDDPDAADDPDPLDADTA